MVVLKASLEWVAFPFVGDGTRPVCFDLSNLSAVPFRFGGGRKSCRDGLVSFEVCEEEITLCTVICLLDSGTLLIEAIRVSLRCVIECCCGPFSVTRRGGKSGRLFTVSPRSFLAWGTLAECTGGELTTLSVLTFGAASDWALLLPKPFVRKLGVELSSLLGGVLKGETLSSLTFMSGSKLGLDLLLGSLAGTLGFSARLRGGCAFASAVSMLLVVLIFRTDIGL